MMMTEEQLKTMINLARRQGYIAAHRDIAGTCERGATEFAGEPAKEVLADFARALRDHAAEASEELKKETEAFEKELQEEAAEND